MGRGAVRRRRGRWRRAGNGQEWEGKGEAGEEWGEEGETGLGQWGGDWEEVMGRGRWRGGNGKGETGGGQRGGGEEGA